MSSGSTEEFVQKKEGAYKYKYNSTIILSQTMKTNWLCCIPSGIYEENLFDNQELLELDIISFIHNFKYLMQGWNC